MIQPLRKFSITLNDSLPTCYPDQYTADKVYPVLALTTNDEVGEDLVIIANNQGELSLIEFGDCRVVSIDD